MGLVVRLQMNGSTSKWTYTGTISGHGIKMKRWRPRLAARVHIQTRQITQPARADGEKRIGTMSAGQGGDAPIADGKVAGDTVSFSMTREMNGSTSKWTYAVSDDEIKMKRAGGQG